MRGGTGAETTGATGPRETTVVVYVGMILLYNIIYTDSGR